jgi:adenylate cyclase
MPQGTQRRLAAIVSTDVVGYSRLMGIDEIGTLAALRQHRTDLIDGKIEEHGGRIVKTMGDGLLLEFPSVVDAVRSMLEIQTGMAERNEGVGENRRIVLRIGINLGDIIIDGDDIHGDGVNIAARLQAIARPGGIAVSDPVNGQIQNRLDAVFSDDGEHNVKNIARPVRVWRWAPGGGEPTRAEARSEPEKPSIAVLPFTNMSGDPEQEYFSDGITEDIITDLSKASGLFVIARNSSFSYKGQSPDVRQVCRELGVRYVLEGSVRRAGNRVRINAQLINGDDGGHLWAERYDRDLEDIFAVQDEVTREIVAALQVELTPLEEGRRSDRGKVNPEAFDHLYRGRACLFKFDAGDLIEGRRMLELAVELDPDLVQAHAMLSIISSTEYVNGWNGADAGHLDRALALAEKAVAIDNDDPSGHFAHSLCQTWRRELAGARRAAERAIDLDPNFASGYSALGQALDFMGQHGRAAEMFQQAFLLDPQVDLMLHFKGRAQMALGLYDEAEANFKSRIIRSPGTDTTRAYLAALYGQTGRIEEARQVWRELMEVNPGFDVERTRATLPYRDAAFFERFFGGLANADLPARGAAMNLP